MTAGGAGVFAQRRDGGFVPAHRIAGFGESVIREMTRLAEVHDAINLSQGYPDFAAPSLVKDAAVAAIHGDQNQYAVTWGAPDLRRAIAASYAERGWPGLDPEREVTVACGATETITAAALALVEEGSEVLVFEPLHESYAPATLLSGSRAVPVPLRPPGWTFEPDDLRRLAGPRARAIVITNPHNPTGRVFTAEELESIASVCRERDLIALTDEIYEHIVYEDEHRFLARLPGMAGRTVTVSSLSKTYAVTGWRVGWAVAPPPLTDAIRKVHDFLTISAPAPFQAAGVTALGLGAGYHAGLRDAYRERRDAMLGILADAGIAATPPQGAYYVLGDVTPHIAAGGFADSSEFAHWLVREARVAVVPGPALFLTLGAGASLVRFAFPKRPETLAEAGRRLVDAARALGVPPLPVFAQRRPDDPRAATTERT
jgi:aminotransferase